MWWWCVGFTHFGVPSVAVNGEDVAPDVFNTRTSHRIFWNSFIRQEGSRIEIFFCCCFFCTLPRLILMPEYVLVLEVRNKKCRDHHSVTVKIGTLMPVHSFTAGGVVCFAS